MYSGKLRIYKIKTAIFIFKEANIYIFLNKQIDLLRIMGYINIGK